MTVKSLTSATHEQQAAAVHQRAKPLRLGETGTGAMYQVLSGSSRGPNFTAPGDDAAAPPAAPSFSQITSENARAVSRLLARTVPQAEADALFEEHGDLVEKKLDDGLTKKETARLAYVRWQLDRIEDARVGAEFDALEELAVLQEKIADEVQSFAEHVKDVSRPPRYKRDR